MRDSYLTMGEMAQFMAEQESGVANFARRRKKGSSKLKTGLKAGLVAGAGYGLYRGATKTRTGQRIVGGAMDRINRMRGPKAVANNYGPKPPRKKRK